MTRQAVITGGVAYHHALTQPGEILADFIEVPVSELVSLDLNRFDLIVVPRSADQEVLFARRHQFERFLDRGGVLIALGESWSNWFPGCRWSPECAEDIEQPVVVGDHPIVDGLTASQLHWHPAKESWCCHGHFSAPEGAEVLVANRRGDAWLYIDRSSTNGVIIASSNLDPDTHAFHGSSIARDFFERLLDWAREAAELTSRQPRRRRPIAGYYSGVHFQRGFYYDPEFADSFAVVPAIELNATSLLDYSALWIPRESNQDILRENRGKLVEYLDDGGTIVCFDEVNQPWLPAGHWEMEKADLEQLELHHHPIVDGLTLDDVHWHSHGVYRAYPNLEVLIEDGRGGIMLFLDERTFAGKLLAGTIDPGCHAGYGTGVTRPLLRGIFTWLAGVPSRAAA